ncbi:MAG: cell division protein ZapA [Bacteroidales bacterium]|nr:cell division protein ZapA [Bacteroidales bacterium]
MDQKIKVTIANKEFNLVAKTPEIEERIRKAAEITNRKIAAYSGKFATKTQLDILCFVALNEAMNGLELQAKLGQIEKETREVQMDIASYIENEGK